MGAYQVRGIRNVIEHNTGVTPFETKMRRISTKCGQGIIQHACSNPMTRTGFGIRMILGPLVRRESRHHTAPWSPFTTIMSQSRVMKESGAGHLNVDLSHIPGILKFFTSRAMECTVALRMSIVIRPTLTIPFNPYPVIKAWSRSAQLRNRKKKRGTRQIPS